MSLAMVLGFSSASGVRVCDARDCRRPPRHTVRVWWGPHRADPARVCGEHRRELELAGLVEDPMGCPVAGCSQAVGSGRRMCPDHTQEARGLGYEVPQRGAISRDLLLELGRRQRERQRQGTDGLEAPKPTDDMVIAALRAEVQRMEDRLRELEVEGFRRADLVSDLQRQIEAGLGRESRLIEELQSFREQVQQLEGVAELREQALAEAVDKARTAEATVAYQAAAQVEGYALAAQQLRHLLEFSPAAASELGRAAAEAVVAGHGDRDLCRRRLAQLPGLMAELVGPADGLYRPRAELVLQMVLPGLGDGEAPRPRVGDQAAALAGRVWQIDLYPAKWTGPVSALGGELLAVDDADGVRHLFSARNPHLRATTVSDEEWARLQARAAERAARARSGGDEDIPW